MPKHGRKTSPATKGGVSTRVIKGITPGAKRPYRLHPGTAQRRRVVAYQKSVKNNIPRATLDRVVRECATEAADYLNFPSGDSPRISSGAAELIHVVAESFITDLFAGSVKLMINSTKSVQLMQRHVEAYLDTLPADHLLVDDPYDTDVPERVGPSAITKDKTPTTKAEVVPAAQEEEEEEGEDSESESDD